MIPNFIVAVLNAVLVFPSETFNARRLLAVKLFFGPLHSFIELTGDTVYSFFIVCLIVPIIACTGYLAGYYGIYPFAKMLGKK